MRMLEKYKTNFIQAHEKQALF